MQLNLRYFTCFWIIIFHLKHQLIKSLIPLFFCFCLFFACKKECTQSYPVSGPWEGTYIVTGRPGTFSYSLILNQDGRIITEGRRDDGNLYYAVGTYTMNGSKLTYTINPFNTSYSQTATLTFSDEGKLTNGTWRYVNAPSMLSGTFPTMQRVNLEDKRHPLFGLSLAFSIYFFEISVSITRIKQRSVCRNFPDIC